MATASTGTERPRRATTVVRCGKNESAERGLHSGRGDGNGDVTVELTLRRGIVVVCITSVGVS